jgi:hypothetical protein
MNTNNEKYNRYALCKEMLETADVVRNYDISVVEPFAEDVKNENRLFLTG